MGKRLTSSLRALALLNLVAGCAPATQTNGSATSSMPATQPSAAASPAGLMGTWTATLADTDLPAAVPQESRAELTGAWVVAFHEGNHFVATHGGTQVVQGSYQISGNQLTFATGETGPAACNQPATYNWQVNNGQLTFTTVGQDPCGGRAVVLTSRPFTRQP